MKVTIDLPEGLYRQVKAKSALEGRPVRGVAEELFRGYVQGETRRERDESGSEEQTGKAPPPWFGVLREHARHAENHEIEEIRKSIGLGLARDRDL